MKLVAMVCPSCGAQVQVDRAKNQAYCVHCGAQLFIDDGVQRSEVRVSYDRSGEADNLYRLASAAFAAANYREAYEYYTRYLEVMDDVPADIYFRRGLSAAYLSGSGTLRIPELFQGIDLGVREALKRGKEEEILRFAWESYLFVSAAFAPYASQDKNMVFPSDQALYFYIARCSQLAEVLKRVLGLLPYERLRKFPAGQKTVQSAAALGVDLLTRASKKYKYVSGSRRERRGDQFVVVDTHASYTAPNALQMMEEIGRFKERYHHIPYVDDTLRQMTEEIAKLEQGSGAFEAELGLFWQQNPALYEAYRKIPLIGRKKKQEAFKAQYFPPDLLKREGYSLNCMARLVELRKQKEAFLSQHIL